MPGDEVGGGTAGAPFDISGASGTLTFDNMGQLTDPAAGSPIAFDITGLADGAADMHVDWDPYTAAGAGRITQFGQPSAPSASSQNGSAAAQLVRVGLADGGRILAQYSNGDQVVVGQLAMASIRNPDTLLAAGNNNFAAQRAHGHAVDRRARARAAAGRSWAARSRRPRWISPQEFTNLIVYQRGYEANSRVVTTADQLSQDTINLIH